MATGYTYSFAHSNIGTCSQLVEKLRDLAEGAAGNPPSGSKGSFCSLQGLCVQECVVSETHVALLLEDGRVCRIRYCEEMPTPVATSKERSDDEGASTSSARSLGSRSVSPRPESEERGSSSVVHALGSLLGSSVPSAASASQLRSRSRILLRRRGAGRSLVARWPIMPASEVPDDLVDQAMAVLQGKSREMVIRELQRTSLDVNQAVNNLLSRDDDDGGEGGHEEGVVGFFPSGEELLNLLGSGLAGVGEEELEEALGRGREEVGGRESRVGVYEISDPLLQNEIRSLVTLGDGAAGGGASVSYEVGRGKKKRKESASGPQLFDNDVEWWGGEEVGLKFQHISGLYSDLLAVDVTGRLHTWAWQSHLPHALPLALERELGLEGEKIRLIAGRVLRASVITESGKVATWLDQCVSSVSSRLEHPATAFPELAGEGISQLLVCELFTAVSTDSGKIFWWGVLPFTERKQAIGNVQDRIRQLRGGGSRGEIIVHGSRVCMRTNPLYTVGSKAIHLKGGQIQCGILQESVFSSSLTEKVRFRVLTSPLEDIMDTGEQLRVVVEGVTLGTKRKFSEDVGVIREEMWSLRDVIFTETVQTVKLGTVVKVDGCYMAVHYPALDVGADISQADLANCRLLRRDELVVGHEGLSYQTPSCIQDTPKRLRIPSTHQLLGVGCDTRGLHAMSSARSLVCYLQFNMNTGKVSQNSQFSELVSQFLIRQGAPLQLIPINLSLLLLLDKHGGLFPLARDIGGGMKDLPLLNLPPVTCVGVGTCSSRNCLITVGFRRQVLMSAVMRCDVTALRTLLEQAVGDPAMLATLLSDCCSGGCNVLHSLALLGRPPDPSPSHGEKKGLSSSARTTPRRGVIREIMKQAMSIAGGIPPQPATDSSSWCPDDLLSGDPLSADPVGCVELLASLPECRPILEKLMKDKNLDGYTPFMAAIACKSYAVALQLFDLAEQLSGGSEESLLAMVYPPDSHADDNPLFVLCRNDACSFTWTGEEHVQQDIFECHTCGLTGSLCCCTECAYNCHRGHDCSFKRASPTAYCDCWERGKCCALAPGDNTPRQSLLLCLLKRTPLGTRVNAKKEHLLAMLAATVARQSKEQSHWSALRSSSSYRTHRTRHDDTPAHDLPPPKFAQKALSIVMEDWESVMCTLQSGMAEQVGEPLQSTTTNLDAFTYTLLAKLSAETLDSLLTVLVKQMGPFRTNEEALSVCQRFLRSVVRVYTVCQLEAANIPTPPLISSYTTTKRKSSASPLVERAEHVFASLAPLAVFQLVSMARAVILPVSMGVARPVHSLCMSDRHKTSMEMFSLPPTSLLRVPVVEEEGGGEGGVEADTESEMGDGEESVGGVLTHDASSTATIGSNPLYLSDQDSTDGEELESGPEDISLIEDRHDDDLLDILPHRTPSHLHWSLPSSLLPTTSSRLSRANVHRECINMGTSASLLAQTFSLLVRQTADCLERCWDLLHSPTPPCVLPVREEDPGELYGWVWGELEGVWMWLVSAMDELESQLCLGNAVSRKIPKDRPRSESTPESLEGRKSMFSYVLTLLRGQHQEHGGVLPAIDVAGMEHLAWCVDAFFYLLQNTRPACPQPSLHSLPLGVAERRFFRRSPSTTCLGYVPPSPFSPLSEALPLAERPHLLEAVQVGARDNCKATLFGFQHATRLECWPRCPLDDPPVLNLISTKDNTTKLHNGKKQSAVAVDLDLSADQVCGLDCHQLSANLLVGRWSQSTTVFSMIFMESVGSVQGSFLVGEQSFQAREKEFRREMDVLRTSAHREIVIELDRARDKLLPALFQELNLFIERHSNGSPQLCVHRMKVTFQREPGEGSGVLRSLFTAVAEGVLSEDALPKLKPLPRPKRSSSPGEGRSKTRERQRMGLLSISSQIVPRSSPSRGVTDASLFYQPGRPGFYAPRAGTNSPERLNAYRNVGRMMGLALLHTEVMPIQLCRHIFKYILGREIGWQDLAFFDPVLYESLRRMILASREEEGLHNLGVTFTVTLCPEEGGENVELVPGGSSVAVTTENVYEYVHKYAKLRMVHIGEEPLQKLREGVYDVLPENALSGLSAEDLRLILCGRSHIDIEVLRSITIFDDESRKEQEVLTRYKGWFWSILERMTHWERQELLYFWTSSPALPASVDSYQPPPSVTLRPPTDQHLPTANTCIARLYLPIYSSRAILRNRLLTAIKTRTFGFV